MKIFLVFFSFCFCLATYAQQEDVLFTVDNVAVKADEFKRVYEKNLDLVTDNDAKNIDKYLDLYINYKLKVKQAYTLGLDTSKTFVKEINSYKKQLALPYLQDQKLIASLVKTAYYRKKNEIRASHILVSFPKGMKENDTLALYAKILNARKRILAGESFKKVALEVSTDPSVKKNYGDLGYFSAFNMVYPFEEAAYTTKIGEVSMPFKTRFGYHIVTKIDERPAKGEFEVAHILIKDKTIGGKVLIDSVYQKLKAGESFAALAKKYSNDTGAAKNGGKLPRFGIGKMVKQFEDAVLSLQNTGDCSSPFKTKYGWHIVQLIKKHPVLSFEELKTKLTRKVKSSGRAKIPNLLLLKRLKNEYQIDVNTVVLKKFKESNNLSSEEKKAVILSINTKHIKASKFSKYLAKRKNIAVDKAFEDFTNTEIITYFKENLIHTEPEYKNTLQEYKDGVLLFDLMREKLWDKTTKDTLGLQNYFNAHKEKYKGGTLEENKLTVVNDYQLFLEEQWHKELRNTYTVKINKKAVKRFKKAYNQ